MGSPVAGNFGFSNCLLAWYDAEHRTLPWRESTDLYPVWLSEIMLQQTRVEAVIPYFHRFLDRFPDLHALAAAAESDVLAAWSGLGYYSRARSLHRAAREVAATRSPETVEELRALPGIGEYTAAAIGSIVLHLPVAAVDGNVLRVVSRVTNDGAEISLPATRKRFLSTAQQWLDTRRPGDFNQAMMELGATLCTPRNPQCGRCPVASSCAARAAGTERQLPVKAGKAAVREVPLHVLILLRRGKLFLVRRDASEKRLAGFWELPRKDGFTGLHTEPAGSFTHQIVNDRFRVTVWKGQPPGGRLPGGRWFSLSALTETPVTTVTRKALHAHARI